MPGICTGSARDGGAGCEHLTLTVYIDGVEHVIKTGRHDQNWDNPLDAEETATMLRLMARWWKGKGASLSAFAGRVLVGEEGSNMRQYVLLAKDVTKTNIGTNYLNLLPALNGERTLVDFTGCTELRVIANANHVTSGSGNLQLRVIRDSDDALIYEGSLGATAGEKELDSGWVALPAVASGLIQVRVQGKSSVGADDPIFRRAILLVR